MSKSNKQKNEAIQKKLKQECDLISESVDFWAAEIDKVFNEIDKFEELPEFEQDYKVMEGLLQKLEKLVAKGDQEKLVLDKFEVRFNKLWGGLIKQKKAIKKEDCFRIKLPNGDPE